MPNGFSAPPSLSSSAPLPALRSALPVFPFPESAHRRWPRIARHEHGWSLWNFAVRALAAACLKAALWRVLLLTLSEKPLFEQIQFAPVNFVSTVFWSGLVLIVSLTMFWRRAGRWRLAYIAAYLVLSALVMVGFVAGHGAVLWGILALLAAPLALVWIWLLLEGDLLLGGGLLMGIVLIAVAHGRVWEAPRVLHEDDITIAPPLPVQMLAGGGDRFFAANIAVFRAMIVRSGGVSPETFRTVAKVQKDAAILNPAHEDNYYTAAGVLVQWQPEETQFILEQAMHARPYDQFPFFFHGFNQMFYNPQGAYEDILRAAYADSHQVNRLFYLDFAARLVQRTQNLQLAAEAVQRIASASRDPQFKRTMELRLQRIQGAQTLQAAAATYRTRFRRPLLTLQALVETHLLPELPVDPFGIGYVLDADGVPQLAQSTLPRAPWSGSGAMMPTATPRP